MQRLLNGQILFAVILLALNSIYASQLLTMRPPFATGEPGPTFLPYILCLFVYGASVHIFFVEFRKRSVSQAGEMSSYVPRIGLVGPVVAIGLSALFIIAFFFVGYLAATALYTFLMSLFFNYEQDGTWGSALVRSALTAVVVTTFGWLFFVVLFDLYLPVWEL